MDSLNNSVMFINDNFLGYVLIIALLGCGVYFTVATRFVQFLNLGEMAKALIDKDAASQNISPFQALCISTAARVGTGNIAGVTIAIATAGPGAVFWMWLIALIGAASAFAESTLAQIYKVKDGPLFRGGPAYYMQKGLGKRWPALLFSVILIITFGLVFNSVQANTIAQVFHNSFAVKSDYMGLFLCLVTGAIIFGGLRRIAHFSQVVVPFFAVVYILFTLAVMLLNIEKLPGIFASVFSEAFSLKNAAGGALGATIMTGARRGLFSNEAGMGSAPNAAATAKTSHPVKQGYAQALGVFVDTLVICSCTAFIVLLTDYKNIGGVGIVMTQGALAAHAGKFGVYFICFSLFLFAFTSIIGNYYYSQANVEYISRSKRVMFVFRILVLAMVLFGAHTQVAVVWNLADMTMTLMALINITAVLLLRKFVLLALKNYRAQRDAGKDPVFKTTDIKGLGPQEAWEE
ncbi:MAG: alanine:cation symporter family protein [Elusimicrobiota bacterium]|nr:alanine:cation symporter family protein [Elusimicrobiota bacterium]